MLQNNTSNMYKALGIAALFVLLAIFSPVGTKTIHGDSACQWNTKLSASDPDCTASLCASAQDVSTWAGLRCSGQTCSGYYWGDPGEPLTFEYEAGQSNTTWQGSNETSYQYASYPYGSLPSCSACPANMVETDTVSPATNTPWPTPGSPAYGVLGIINFDSTTNVMCTPADPPVPVQETCPAPLTQTQTIACPVGQTGSIHQTQTKNAAPDCSWGSWQTTSSTCAPDPNYPPAPACSSGQTCASVSVSASPQTINSGDGSTISWSSTGTSACYGAFMPQYPGAGPTSGGTTVYPSTTTNYAVSCTSNIGGNNPSDSATVNVTPAQQQPTTADVHVSSNVSTSWTIQPENKSGSGTSGDYTMSPGVENVAYVITPATLSGYTMSVSNSDGGGASLLLSGGDSKTFNISYSSSAGWSQYTLSNSGTTNVTKGNIDAYGQNVITKTLTSSPTQSVDLSLSGVPSGVDYAIVNRACSPTCNSTINFTVHSTASAGTYPITVTGTPGNQTTQFYLDIQNSTSVNVSCIATPSPATLGQPVVWSTSVSGGVPPYTYAWNGSNIPVPAPTSNSLNVTYTTVGTKTANTTVTDSVGNTATCNGGAGATVQVNFNPKFEEF